MFFQTPRINTDDLVTEMIQPDQLPAPGMVQLARTINGYIDTPAEPIHQHVRAFQVPLVPWDFGWHFPNLDLNAWARRIFPMPLQAPQVSYGTGGYVAQVANAVNPVPTLAATGVTQSLRAPSINEGYSY